MAAVVEQLKQEGYPVQDSDLAHIWPTRYAHINVYGKYHFNVEEAHRRKGLRPLRQSGVAFLNPLKFRWTIRKANVMPPLVEPVKTHRRQGAIADGMLDIGLREQSCPPVSCDIRYAESSSSNALASCKSVVSNPSVNQP